MSSRQFDVDTGGNRKFNFPGQVQRAASGLAISVLLMVVAYEITGDGSGSVSFGRLVAIGLSLLFFFSGLQILWQQSDILLGDQAIARSLFGWKWQKLKWDTITTIRIVPQFDLDAKKMARVFSVSASIPRESGTAQLKSMRFSDCVVNASEFAESLDRCAAHYKIAVEFEDSKISTSRAHH